MASFLRPGKAVQVSIQDNQWLRGKELEFDRVKAVTEFLRDVFDLRLTAEASTTDVVP